MVDYAAKGTRIDLDGIEKVDGRDAYKLKLTLKNGEAMHVWLDAETFLEAKIEGTPRRLDGKYHPVEVYFRDFRPVSGLLVPDVLETKVQVAQNGAGSRNLQSMTEKIIIDKVVVNPKFDDSVFVRPQI